MTLDFASMLFGSSMALAGVFLSHWLRSRKQEQKETVGLTDPHKPLSEPFEWYADRTPELMDPPEDK